MGVKHLLCSTKKLLEPVHSVFIYLALMGILHGWSALF